MRFRIFLGSPPTGLNRDIQHPDGLPFYVPPSLITLLQWYRNINLFPITYACRPQLRDRLTLRRLALLRKPWVFGEPVSHRLYRYLCRQGHFCWLHQFFRSDFVTNRTLLYQRHRPQAAPFYGFGPVLEPRYIVGPEPLDQ